MKQNWTGLIDGYKNVEKLSELSQHDLGAQRVESYFKLADAVIESLLSDVNKGKRSAQVDVTLPDGSVKPMSVPNIVVERASGVAGEQVNDLVHDLSVIIRASVKQASPEIGKADLEKTVAEKIASLGLSDLEPHLAR